MGKTSSVAKDRYNSKAYDEIKIRVRKGQKEVIQSHAKNYGESLNRFIDRAICERTGERVQLSEDSSVSPQSSSMVSLPTNTLKTTQEAAEAQGEETAQFIERAISMQIERDKVQRIINKQSKKGGE